MDLRSILEENGHEVMVVAVTVNGALQVARTHPCMNLAVIDVDFPGRMDGVDTARRLLEDDDRASLFVSAKLTDEVRARAAKCNPVNIIDKPFGELDIRAAMADFPHRRLT